MAQPGPVVRLWFVREKRDRMARSVPEWEALREAAARTKIHTVTHLAHYLEMFERNATANGIHVHWAKDAQEHNEIVYGILKAGQEQVHARRGMRPVPLPGGARHRGRRERPRRAHHAAYAPAAQPHSPSGHSCQEAGSGRALRTRDRHRARQQRPDLPHPRRQRTPARQVSPCRRGHDRSQFRRGLVRSLRRMHQRGQRRHGHLLPHPPQDSIPPPTPPTTNGPWKARRCTSSSWTTAAAGYSATPSTATCSNACAAEPA